VHHVDLDLDASTALRFHFGELALSVPWRAAQIIVIGVTTDALTLWQNALLISILFHHSNVKLPIDIERAIGYVFVTPRMHGIHHSMVPDETNSNWSSGFTLWDSIHGMLQLNAQRCLRDVRRVTARIHWLQYREDVSHLIELFYSEHCFSCPETRSVIHRLASQRSDIVIVEHNVDDDLRLATQYHLIATPALVIDRGKVLYGIPRLETLADRIDASAPALE
jgi:hypothetical protein